MSLPGETVNEDDEVCLFVAASTKPSVRYFRRGARGSVRMAGPKETLVDAPAKLSKRTRGSGHIV